MSDLPLNKFFLRLAKLFEEKNANDELVGQMVAHVLGKFLQRYEYKITRFYCSAPENYFYVEYNSPYLSAYDTRTLNFNFQGTRYMDICVSKDHSFMRDTYLSNNTFDLEQKDMVEVLKYCVETYKITGRNF